VEGNEINRDYVSTCEGTHKLILIQLAVLVHANLLSTHSESYIWIQTI
jgi:hypothetical protein